MDKNISITVPYEHGALMRAAEMFTGLASDMTTEVLSEAETTTPEDLGLEPPVEVKQEIAKSEGFVPPAPEPESDAAVVFAAPTPEAVVTPTPEADTGLDKNGLPWDTRIHAGTKTKLVTGEWKNKRGIDKDLLASVEAELKGAAPEPVDIQVHAASAPHDKVVTPAPTGAVATFPDLMTAITARGLEPAIVNGAVQAVGLASLPLLATRPDLIPDVAQRLGL